MSIINVIDLSLEFSGRQILNKVGLQVNPGDRIGLVGPNGSGKTSLLKLLTGKLSPDSGEIRMTSGMRTGHLAQDAHEDLSGPLLQYVLNSIPGRLFLNQKIEKIEKALKEETIEQEQEKLATRLAELHHKIADLDIKFPSHKAEKILEGLGFKTHNFDSPISLLSGGWKMRVALASILYQNPDLLLLDEPTNHLDIPSVRWLESFLKEYKGAIILVCHDRDFLNRQINRVVSFEPEGLRSYTGNYDQYLIFREEEEKNLKARQKNQEIKIKEAKKFIERFRYKATKARQAQSKLKLLEKIELVRTHKQHKKVKFKFPEVPSSGKMAITIEGVTKGFDGPPLYRDLHLTIMRGERVAIIGANGSGKTTLLKILAGELTPDEGRVTLGHNIAMSYYAQHHSEILNPNKTILEEVYQIVPNETVSFVRGVCGAFLFSGDDVDKPIKVLSGGEKARVCLAEILIKPGNLMVMDEPTNHLDLVSSEVLIDALKDYNGTLLFVSHNQSFVNQLATRIWDIRDENIVEYPGTLYEYYQHLAKIEKMQGGNSAMRETEFMETPEKNAPNRRQQRKEKAEKRQLVYSTLKPIKEKLVQIEKRIAELEEKEKTLGAVLADPELFKDTKKSVPLLNEYSQIKKKLEDQLRTWEEMQTKLEGAESKLEALS